MTEPARKTIDGLCPWCKAPLADGAVLCVKCGYHLERGAKLDVHAEPKPAVSETPAHTYRFPGKADRANKIGRPSVLGYLISSHGRIPRWHWWVWQILFFVVVISMGNLIKFRLVRLSIPVAVILQFMYFFLLAQIRRWHDIDRSGWWLLVNLIPGGAIYTFIVLCFTLGTDGPNRYGPDPLER